MPAKTWNLTFRDVDISVGDYFKLTGDFTTQNFPDRVLYGARNVTLFLGDGPYLLDDGTVNQNAIGVVVKSATVGIVKYINGPDPADDTFAVSGWGAAELVGLPGLTVSGTLRVPHQPDRQGDQRDHQPARHAGRDYPGPVRLQHRHRGCSRSASTPTASRSRTPS